MMIRNIAQQFVKQNNGRPVVVVTGLRTFSKTNLSLDNSNINYESSSTTSASSTKYSMAKYFNYTPDDGFIRTSSFKSIEIPNLTIDQYVWKNMNRWQDKVAIVCGETGRQYTYSKLRDHTAAFAVRLQHPNFNLKQNDVIAICLPNIPEFPIASLGAIQAGLVITSLNPIYTPDEIAKQLNDSDAKLLVGTVESYPLLQAAVNKLTKPIKIIVIKLTKEETIPTGAIDFYELINLDGVQFNNLRQSTAQPNELAFLPYSSGTTGLCKGVMLSHNNITSNSEQINTGLPDTPLVDPTTTDFQDVLPSVLPFFHIYGFSVLMVSKLALGVKVLSLPRFNPETFLRSLVMHKGTVVHLVPPIINFLASHPAVETKHLASIRSVMSGAAPIAASDIERFIKKVGRPVDFLQGYGLTETSPVVLMNIKGSSNYGSCGGLTPNTEAKICDINDSTYKGLDANESGELLVRGPQCMLGYFKNPEASAEMIVKDNKGIEWIRTGDIGHYDKDGYFYITERLKELIKVKGFQVPPAELEALLRNHPKILDAAVVGTIHPTKGEVPRAFVVKKPGQEIEAIELQEYVAERVAEFKRLDGGVEFLTDIPKNSTGKIMRRQLKEKYCK